MMKNNKYLSLNIGLVIFVSACTSIPQNAALTEAHNNYNTVRTDPQVTSMAALELQEASNYLEKADHALKERKEDEAVNHLAYLANQQIAIARETAKAKSTESQIAEAKAKRDQVLLAARSAEVDEAKQQVIASQMLIDQQQRELAELNAKKTARGLMVTLDDVLFRTNMSQLEPGGIRTVQKVADFLRQYSQQRVLIEGHTDSTGSHHYNQALSERRANAARQTLIDSGVNPARIETRGYGENYPVASNDNAEGRQLNRRVEIIFSDEQGYIPPR
ncbi:DUF4398 domain-containing protein [Nitrosomonas sp. JL21]|uniref:OmpA family protein n=1 Tax=Nitrosomonas sp. JL21 TaxID=153949 RepID=UPI00136D9C3A|nr:OmpA family protein [Nitrosomonas sp. JL21]MBL8496846.1 DUF4398 and OmpA-like domain-containing protein [Nitrosomonas sp.]MBL8498402.1 DUF4398 and OmpA-like domain-containing protein [Nitrosomonas sp.]MCC7090830.1 DUF4398 and OmpA-like domain-containing protein [Nitrosomonas sp.]MXS77620.1 DUF4398 domain-containing protein [Nitrosomonas sp. JL21]